MAQSSKARARLKPEKLQPRTLLEHGDLYYIFVSKTQEMYDIEKSLIKIRRTWPKPCQHIPLVQSLVHSSFFLEQKYVREDIKSIEKDFQDLTWKIIQEYKG